MTTSFATIAPSSWAICRWRTHFPAWRHTYRFTVGMTWSKGDGSTVTFDCTGNITKNWWCHWFFHANAFIRCASFLVGIFSNIANHDACDVLHALDALLALSARRKNKWDFAWTRQARSWQEAVGRLSDRRKVSFFCQVVKELRNNDHINIGQQHWNIQKKKGKKSVQWARNFHDQKWVNLVVARIFTL